MTSREIDAARLTLALNELRLPAIKALWPRFAEQADKEGWCAARLLSALVEHELAERDRRRTERHLAQARLLPGKTLESFDFAAVPMVSKAHVNAITAGDSWIAKGDNILLFGPPYSSPAPPIWSRNSSRPAAIWRSKAPSPNSTNSTC
jgi:DNA replication protein DnaC